MTDHDQRWVPKVHPLARDAEAEDPFELMAEPVAGDPEVMLECILQEFAWMGWNEEQLLGLFHNPGYPVLCQLREYFGPEQVRQHVVRLLARTGVQRFRETIVEPEQEPDVVSITLPGAEIRF